MKKSKKNLIRLGVAAGLFVTLILLGTTEWFSSLSASAEGFKVRSWEFYAYVLPYVAVYILVGYDVLFRAGRNLFTGRLLDENFLMAVASVGAMLLGDFTEAVAVMLFYQVGEAFQRYAVNKSRKSIAELMDICPQTATVVRGGVETEVFPEEVAVGEHVIVRPGERVSVDGVVTSGQSWLDVSSLTGESQPVSACEGSQVLAGSVCRDGSITVKCQKPFVDSAVSKILDLVENASVRKAKTESFITKFARVYTPAVVGCAVLLAVIPSLITHEYSVWITRALTFLVVSCPCALVISVPMAFFGGIGGASKVGVLVKGGNYLELLARKKIYVFDKTGTLTEGKFHVARVFPKGAEDEVLTLLATAERRSTHPIAQAILRYATPIDGEFAYLEIPGKGVMATADGIELLAGNAACMRENKIEFTECDEAGSAVYLAKNGVFVGYVLVCDRVKSNAKAVIDSIKQSGDECYMLTGDNYRQASAVAAQLGIDSFSAELLPGDKLSEVEKIIKEKSGGRTVCFVGDGINDAPVLSRADVGLSMGAIGSDSAIEASDVVLMRDDLSAIPSAVSISKKTVRIARQNVVLALGVKAAVLVLSALGLSGMWLAVFADVGVAVIAILNSLRALSVRK